jgi:hypothetical protein
LSGGKIYTYQAGTTTPLAVYTSNAESAFHTNPIILDSAGRVPSGGEIWLQLGIGYKFVLRTSTDVLIATYDNIPSSAQPPAANDADSIMYEQGYTVTAGSFVVGKIYRIASVGTTDFTLIGATNNTVGTHFIATGVGTGTGTAELSQTVETKLRETVSVKDFGAVGDGVADDTVEIQAALDSGADAVYFPSGTYNISASLDVSSNTAIYGDSFTSIVESTTSDFYLFEIPNGSSNISFNGIDFVGAATASQATPQWAIYSDTVDASTDVSITDCRFRYVNNAVAFGNGTRYRVQNCVFEHIMGVNPASPSTAGNGYGVASFGASGGYHTVSSNQFIGAVGEGRHAVYFTNGTSYSQITNNNIRDFNEINISVRAESPQPGVIGNIVSGNTCIGGGTSTTAESGCISISGVAKYNTISNNIVGNFDNDGIVISHQSQGANCLRNYVSNNYVFLCGLSGIVVTGSPQTDVVGNRVFNCSQNSSGVSSGITIGSQGSGGSGFAIDPADCNFISNFVTGADNRFAFRILASVPVPTNTNIVANTFNIGTTPDFAVSLNMDVGVVPNYAFNITDQADASGFSDIKQTMSRSGTFDFASIPANTTAELTRAITGVTTTGWVVVASPEGGVIESGLVWSAYVSAANTVTLRIANVTTSAINPASCVWRFDCFRHG